MSSLKTQIKARSSLSPLLKASGDAAALLWKAETEGERRAVSVSDDGSPCCANKTSEKGDSIKVDHTYVRVIPISFNAHHEMLCVLCVS